MPVTDRGSLQGCGGRSFEFLSQALNFSFMCAVSFVGSGQNWDILKAKGEGRSIKKNQRPEAMTTTH